MPCTLIFGPFGKDVVSVMTWADSRPAANDSWVSMAMVVGATPLFVTGARAAKIALPDMPYRREDLPAIMRAGEDFPYGEYAANVGMALLQERELRACSQQVFLGLDLSSQTAFELSQPGQRPYAKLRGTLEVLQEFDQHLDRQRRLASIHPHGHLRAHIEHALGLPNLCDAEGPGGRPGVHRRREAEETRDQDPHAKGAEAQHA